MMSSSSFPLPLSDLNKYDLWEDYTLSLGFVYDAVEKLSNITKN